MKKTLFIILFIICLVPFAIACGNDSSGGGSQIEQPDNGDIEKDPNNKENNKEDNKENNKEDVIVEVKNGTEAAKILLANERLDESILTKSGSLFTDGKKAFSRIIERTRHYLKKNAGRPNETYTEVEGDTYKWYNDIDYSNFMSYFESYAINIESSAKRGAHLIDYTKKNIRVVNKWVKEFDNEYFLMVDKDSETIIERRGETYINMCKRYTDGNGNSVYEMFYRSESICRMKYIPNLLYEFTIQFGNNEDSAIYLYADNSKGYWTIVSSNSMQAYEDPHRGYVETFTPTVMVMKDEANYILGYYVDNNGSAEINAIQMVSSDRKTDLIFMAKDMMILYNTGLRGLDHLEITAPADKVGDYDPDFKKELYVYAQDNVNENGDPYKIYSTSGFKSATAVLENGMTLTEGDTLLDGKVGIDRIDVSYVAGCDSYGTIPVRTTATSFSEQYQILEELLDVTGLTFRRDFDDVINGIEYAIKDAQNFPKYFTWNGYHVNDIESVKQIFIAEKQKKDDILNMYDQIKNLEVIDREDQEKYNASIHFADIEVTNKGTITNEGFKISIKDFSVKVEDTLLFVDKEKYKVVFALLNKDGNLIAYLDENDLVTEYNKGSTFETLQTKEIQLDILAAGEYTLVAYVALASEGIRITNYQPVEAIVSEASQSTYGLKNTIVTNDKKELIIVSEIDYSINCEIEGDVIDNDLLEMMAQLAYDHGMIDELIVEKLVDDNWIVIEIKNNEEEIPEEEQKEELNEEKPIEVENQELETNEETKQEAITYLEKGQYRMKYIVNNEAKEEAYIYVTIK